MIRELQIPSRDHILESMRRIIADEMTAWKEKLNGLQNHFAPEHNFNAGIIRMLHDKTL